MIIYLNAEKLPFHNDFGPSAAWGPDTCARWQLPPVFHAQGAPAVLCHCKAFGAIQFHHWQVPWDRTCWRALPSALSSWLAREPVNIVYFSNGHCWRWFCWIWFGGYDKISQSLKDLGLDDAICRNPTQLVIEALKRRLHFGTPFLKQFLRGGGPVNQAENIIPSIARDIPISAYPAIWSLHGACISSCCWAIRGRVVRDFFHEDTFECFYPMLQVVSFPTSKEKCWVISESIRDEPFELELEWCSVPIYHHSASRPFHHHEKRWRRHLPRNQNNHCFLRQWTGFSRSNYQHVRSSTPRWWKNSGFDYDVERWT